MIETDIKSLLSRMGPYSAAALHGAAGLCIARGHYEVTIEHHLAKLLDESRSDIPLALRAFDIDPAFLQRAVNEALDGLRTGNTSRPVFSPLLMDWFQDAWLVGSVELGYSKIRSGMLLLALVLGANRYLTPAEAAVLRPLRKDDLRRRLPEWVRGSIEDAETSAGEGGEAQDAAALGADSALSRFTINYTAQARKGKIDPVFGRDAEIRQMVDILARRRKNNPIVVGEAGVGKTAVVEGLALRIVAGDVPQVLVGVEIHCLDLGLLQAGAGMRGEFESRLKAVIGEVKASPKPIVLFIDEAHTLIGAGGPQGGGDAANLLKPALARGELRTIAATTWSEYKKYFEKDAALARRFQLVKLDEPDEDAAVGMLRGLASRYEESHGVHIRDDAVVAAVRLSQRYITGRQLPDKAVDLLDTCAARVKIGIASRPAALEDVERRVEAKEREARALARDLAAGMPGVEDRSQALAEQVDRFRQEAVALKARWESEKEAVDRVIQLRRELDRVRSAPSVEGQTEASTEGTAPEPPPRTAAEIRADLAVAQGEMAAIQGKEPQVHAELGPEVVAAVVADWTGIPVGRVMEDQARAVMRFEEDLARRIRGQTPALRAIGGRLRDAKAGLQDPRMPLGVFLLVGPSGVGKTETAIGVADLLFSGERSMVTINMSEFQEKHTVSRLIGSPPGYVGFGEGGVLTEAVRQRPYSVVLLDEVEKADPEVLNLFYQVFDKGSLADGEGREIDFKNTVVFLTSNLATDRLTRLIETGIPDDHDAVVKDIRPILSRHFKPALLARMTIVPFMPLGAGVLREIVDLKLGHLAKRMADTHKVVLTWDTTVADAIASRCTEVETGARNVDHIVRGTLLPAVSHEVLSRLSSGGLPSTMRVFVDDAGAFRVDAGEG